MSIVEERNFFSVFQETLMKSITIEACQSLCADSKKKHF